jgi:hypothetical protein
LIELDETKVYTRDEMFRVLTEAGQFCHAQPSRLSRLLNGLYDVPSRAERVGRDAEFVEYEEAAVPLFYAKAVAAGAATPVYSTRTLDYIAKAAG